VSISGREGLARRHIAAVTRIAVKMPFARRQAFSLDDIDSRTHFVEHLATTLFLVWGNLSEHKRVTFGERRGTNGTLCAGIAWMHLTVSAKSSGTRSRRSLS
jgi:hypothetical protein